MEEFLNKNNLEHLHMIFNDDSNADIDSIEPKFKFQKKDELTSLLVVVSPQPGTSEPTEIGIGSASTITDLRNSDCGLNYSFLSVYQNTAKFDEVNMALINLSAIAELFSDEISVLKKGENSVESGNLIEVNFDGTLSCIKAKVLASMKKRSYHVEIVLKDSSPKEFRCECPRGQFKCHHIAAVLIYASKNISKTDVMCQWKAPSIASSSSSSIATVDDIFPKSAFRATDRDADGDDKQYFYEELQVLNR
ncbi:hypothetical protein RN001_002015 [Aquatica leii]|uniref:SWIM-type domain-containing protein n=1 Tax=Aquatica leii TaxID=1421715 RepID=A0AAN7PGJ6_9COLE|nr:hypothetical protein RN001_002015 [Aquatica leii]